MDLFGGVKFSLHVRDGKGFAYGSSDLLGDQTLINFGEFQPCIG